MPSPRAEADVISRRVRHGLSNKALFVRGDDIFIARAQSDLSRRWEMKSDWSLVGVFRHNVDIESVVEALHFVRTEQRALRRVMRNFDVRA